MSVNLYDNNAFLARAPYLEPFVSPCHTLVSITYTLDQTRGAVSLWLWLLKTKGVSG